MPVKADSVDEMKGLPDTIEEQDDMEKEKQGKRGGVTALDATGVESSEGGAASVGSRHHDAGRCKPCAFYHTKGCESGPQCLFCHMCPAHEKQRRKRLRRQICHDLLSAYDAHTRDRHSSKVQAEGPRPGGHVPKLPGQVLEHSRQRSDASARTSSTGTGPRTPASSEGQHSRQWSDSTQESSAGGSPKSALAFCSRAEAGQSGGSSPGGGQSDHSSQGSPSHTGGALAPTRSVPPPPQERPNLVFGPAATPQHQQHQQRQQQHQQHQQHQQQLQQQQQHQQHQQHLQQPQEQQQLMSPSGGMVVFTSSMSAAGVPQMLDRWREVEEEDGFHTPLEVYSQSGGVMRPAGLGWSGAGDSQHAAGIDPMGAAGVGRMVPACDMGKAVQPAGYMTCNGVQYALVPVASNTPYPALQSPTGYAVPPQSPTGYHHNMGFHHAAGDPTQATSGYGIYLGGGMASCQGMAMPPPPQHEALLCRAPGPFPSACPASYPHYNAPPGRWLQAESSMQAMPQNMHSTGFVPAGASTWWQY